MLVVLKQPKNMTIKGNIAPWMQQWQNSKIAIWS